MLFGLISLLLYTLITTKMLLMLMTVMVLAHRLLLKKLNVFIGSVTSDWAIAHPHWRCQKVWYLHDIRICRWQCLFRVWAVSVDVCVCVCMCVCRSVGLYVCVLFYLCLCRCMCCFNLCLCRCVCFFICVCVCINNRSIL